MPQYSGENREMHSEFPVAGPWSETRIPRLRIKSLNTTSHCVAVSGLRVNRLTPNDPYMGRTAPLTSKRFILYIYSTNIGTEYF